MGHGIDFSTGQAAFYARQHGWHRLGTIAEEPVYELGKALEYGHVGFGVDRRPVLYMGTDGEIREVEGKFVTVRDDTHAPLGVVGNYYRVVQNEEGFRIPWALVDAGLAEFDTIGALNGGQDVWLLLKLKLDQTDIIAEGFDGCLTYALCLNNHAGLRNVILQLTPIHVVCLNTANMSMKDSRARTIRIPHTKSAMDRIALETERLVKQVYRDCEETAKAFIQLRNTKISQETFDKAVLDLLLPEPDRDAFTTQGRYDRAENRAVEGRALLNSLWVEGTGQHGNCTAWDAYNAVTEAIDHFDLMPTKNQGQAMIAGGTWEKAKSDVLQSLLIATN